MADVDATVAAVWRRESATVVAALHRMLGDVGLAEEIAQDALVSALEQWPREGVPDNPAAWLTTVARRRAVDHLRRTRRLDELDEHAVEQPDGGSDAGAGDDPDDVLRLMLMACHPSLAREERVAMTLRLLAGLSTAEIARALLVGEPRVVSRIAAAKRALGALGGPAAGGGPADVRLSSVLEVVYLVFNEGYTATAGDGLLRPELVDEARRLGALLAERAPDEPEVHGLVALMELQASRSATRVDAAGVPVPLAEQDRARWDGAAIRRGMTALLRARGAGPPGPYVLQAAIAATHARAARAEDTDWVGVVALYDALATRVPTGVVRLNRAVAVGEAHGAAAGLAAVDELRDEPALRDYHLVPAVRGDLLRRLARAAAAHERGPLEQEARRELRRAAALTGNDAERLYLLRRADAFAAAAVVGPSLGPTVERFLARDDLGAATRRSYRQTLTRVVRDLGADLPLAALDTATAAAAVAAAWGHVAPATANRHRAALASLLDWSGNPDVADGVRGAVEHRPVRRAGPRPPVVVDDEGAGLRERTLWALLADSRATVSAVLALDVDDLDLARRRAGTVRWGPTTGALLAQLIAGRRRGPVFLSGRRPAPARRPSARDLCPDTGRRRLSYERAEYLFKQHTGTTLRRLR